MSVPSCVLASSVLDIGLNCQDLKMKYTLNVHVLKLVWLPGDEDLNSYPLTPKWASFYYSMVLLFKVSLDCWDQRAHANT